MTNIVCSSLLFQSMSAITAHLHRSFWSCIALRSFLMLCSKHLRTSSQQAYQRAGSMATS
ncbi:hypothetical protein HETIRDRAFT_164897 [Heterobasidion irregulare TC 32-1]|uniref:Uncharacterized protein n=1 Tax=Heterobasidion irregulare (strain TC 32-1) TaxID=747525 RepID=W4JPU6_HETIT|nr:uncharacterized protein HETIRDRAFT_164897 [Heterobasidion irregulare TC 32-1]ETW74896.1 hypothetical protein HETIRDRAFT_164897 [Heterobasidion irregulare TC 32-1]